MSDTAFASFDEIFRTELRAWRGHEPLWKVFWIYGVALSWSMATLYGALLYARCPWLQQILLLCLAGYTVWVLIAIWRCAENAEEAYWGLLARHLTVVWAGATLMLVPFLEIDIVERLLGC